MQSQNIYKFQRKRLNEMSKETMLNELERVAKHFNYTGFGWRDFNNIAKISASSVKKHLGSCKKGLDALKQHLQKKGLNLSPRPHAPNRIYSDKDLFDEIERIWQKISQRPSRTEWEMSEPKIAH